MRWDEDIDDTRIGDVAKRVWNLGVEMNRQRADFIRNRQAAQDVERDLATMRRESAIQAVQERLERDLALAVGCTDYPMPLRKRAEEYTAAVLAQFGIK